MNDFDRALSDHRAGRLAEATAGYRRVLDADPDHADACHLLGLTLHQRDENRLALELVNRSLALQPRVANYHNSLGLILRGLGDLSAAILAFRTAVSLEQGNADAFNNLGTVFSDQRQYAAAEEALRQALLLRPDYAAAQNNLARILVRSGEYDEAIALLRRACATEEHNPNYWNSLGVALREFGDVEEALVAFEYALKRDPNLVDAHVNRAQLWLLTGDFEKGWPEHEWRLHRARFMQRMADRYWTGGDIDGRTVLLWAEQGRGDAIQFIRYAPQVAARGARVIVECPEPLMTLFTSVKGVSAIVRPGDTVKYDVHAALMSLPHILGAGPEAGPYLHASKAMSFDDDTAMRVGLVWAGNPDHANDRNRSFPLTAFAPLFDVAKAGMEFYALQVGDAAGMVAPEGMRLRHLGQGFRDFRDTAEAVAGLDLVISVDTSVAHLAGAMGKETWVILPPNPDWRWGLTGNRTGWYANMRLFRQVRNENSAAVLGRVAEALGNWQAVAQM